MEFSLNNLLWKLTLKYSKNITQLCKRFQATCLKTFLKDVFTYMCELWH